MTELQFRKAEIDDLDALVALYGSAAQDMFRQGIDQWDEYYPDREILAEDVESGDMTLGLLDGEREKVTVTLYGPRMVYGPVLAGDRFGYAAVSLDGRELFRTEVYYEKDVQKPEADQGFWRRLLDRVMGM